MDKRISLLIPENLLKQIDRIIKKKDVNRSIFVRNLLREAVRMDKQGGKS